MRSPTTIIAMKRIYTHNSLMNWKKKLIQSICARDPPLGNNFGHFTKGEAYKCGAIRWALIDCFWFNSFCLRKIIIWLFFLLLPELHKTTNLHDILPRPGGWGHLSRYRKWCHQSFVQLWLLFYGYNSLYVHSIDACAAAISNGGTTTETRTL